PSRRADRAASTALHGAPAVPDAGLTRQRHNEMAAVTSLLNGGRRVDLLPQQVLLNLPGGRLRDAAEHDVARNFEVRQVLAAMSHDLVACGDRAWLQLHKRTWRLPPLVVRLGHNRGKQHGGMAMQHVLDLERRDVFAARDD